MTVQQLIDKLEQLDPTLRIVVRGYEGGFNDVDSIQSINVVLDYHDKWYYGKHELSVASDKHSNTADVYLLDA